MSIVVLPQRNHLPMNKLVQPPFAQILRGNMVIVWFLILWISNLKPSISVSLVPMQVDVFINMWKPPCKILLLPKLTSKPIVIFIVYPNFPISMVIPQTIALLPQDIAILKTLPLGPSLLKKRAIFLCSLSMIR